MGSQHSTTLVQELNFCPETYSNVNRANYANRYIEPGSV